MKTLIMTNGIYSDDRYYSDYDEVLDIIWVNKNRYKIAEKVKSADMETLKEIDKLLKEKYWNK